MSEIEKNQPETTNAETPPEAEERVEPKTEKKEVTSQDLVKAWQFLDNDFETMAATQELKEGKVDREEALAYLRAAKQDKQMILIDGLGLTNNEWRINVKNLAEHYEKVKYEAGNKRLYIMAALRERILASDSQAAEVLAETHEYIHTKISQEIEKFEALWRERRSLDNAYGRISGQLETINTLADKRHRLHEIEETGKNREERGERQGRGYTELWQKHRLQPAREMDIDRLRQRILALRTTTFTQAEVDGILGGFQQGLSEERTREMAAAVTSQTTGEFLDSGVKADDLITTAERPALIDKKEGTPTPEEAIDEFFAQQETAPIPEQEEPPVEAGATIVKGETEKKAKSDAEKAEQEKAANRELLGQAIEQLLPDRIKEKAPEVVAMLTQLGLDIAKTTTINPNFRGDQSEETISLTLFADPKNEALRPELARIITQTSYDQAQGAWADELRTALKELKLAPPVRLAANQITRGGWEYPALAEADAILKELNARHKRPFAIAMKRDSDRGQNTRTIEAASGRLAGSVKSETRRPDFKDRTIYAAIPVKTFTIKRPIAKK